MSPPDATPADVYIKLRNRILTLNPAEIGLAPSDQLPHVWGAMMETGYEAGSVTLVALSDGTTSLYFSTGGGMLGSGEFEPVAKASKALVSEAENILEMLSPTDNFPQVRVGAVRFYILTYEGVYYAEALEQMLSAGKHTLSRLYLLAQDTIAQLRILRELKR